MSNLSCTITDTGNLTDPAIIHTVALMALVDGPLGWQQFQTSLSVSVSNGHTWTISLRTFDFVAIVSAFILLAFAVDLYFFNSRYLLHVGGTRTATVGASTTQEKHARDVESGKERSYEIDSRPQPQSVYSEDSRPRSLSSHARCLKRVAFIVLVLFAYPIPVGGNEKAVIEEITPTSRSELLENPGSSNKQMKSPSCNRLGQPIRHSWARKISGAALFLVVWLFMAFIFLWRILFWPNIFVISVLCQGLIHETFYPRHSFQWKSLALIALMSLLRLAFWTIAVAALVLRPNRIQGTLWKAFRWTHAITWWLFWGSFEMYLHVHRIFKVLGLPYVAFGDVYFLALMPSLTIMYLYSGIVMDVADTVLMVQKSWKTDGTRC